MLIKKDKIFTDFFTEHKGSRSIDFIVLHHVEASSVNDAILQFLQHQVSAHFVIDEEGKIFQLVEENNIAYHAGVSFWKGFEGLNKNSIGIEFINKSPFAKKFTEVQMLAGVDLCSYLIKKYKIEAQNILGHSDIAYNSETGFLDRKQDPSELFDWRFLAQKNIGIYPKKMFVDLKKEPDRKLFSIGDKNVFIAEIKNKLAKFGYRIFNFNDEFDLEMQALTRVFNRRFNQDIFSFSGDQVFLKKLPNNKIASSDAWYLSSQFALEQLD